MEKINENSKIIYEHEEGYEAFNDSDFVRIAELCRRVAKHKVLDDEGAMNSVAFGGNCGIFAYYIYDFLCTDRFDAYDFEYTFGFIFENCTRRSDIWKEEVDLNHVVLCVDGHWFDGSGELSKEDLASWYGKMFKFSNLDEVIHMIKEFTYPSVHDDRLIKLFETEWKKLEKESDTMKENTKVTLTIGQLKKLVKESKIDWSKYDWEEDPPRDLELYKVYHHLEQKLDDAIYQYHCRMNLQIRVSDRANVVSELKRRGYEVLKSDHRFKFLRNGDKLAISKEEDWSVGGDNGVELFVLHVSKGTPEYNQILWLAEQEDFGDDGIWWKNM